MLRTELKALGERVPGAILELVDGIADASTAALEVNESCPLLPCLFVVSPTELPLITSARASSFLLKGHQRAADV